MRGRCDGSWVTGPSRRQEGSFVSLWVLQSFWDTLPSLTLQTSGPKAASYLNQLLKHIQLALLWKEHELCSTLSFKDKCFTAQTPSLCVDIKKKDCILFWVFKCAWLGLFGGGFFWLVFFTAILRLLDLLRGRSKLWLNPADNSLADLRIFQILKYMCGFLQTPQNSENIRPVSPFPR